MAGVCFSACGEVQLSPYSHPLFFPSTENVHPVLDSIPAALPVQDVTQLNIIQVFLQHLYTNIESYTHTQWQCGGNLQCRT